MGDLCLLVKWKEKPNILKTQTSRMGKVGYIHLITGTVLCQADVHARRLSFMLLTKSGPE